MLLLWKRKRINRPIILGGIKMTDDEYVKEFCSKCINRKGFEDICEIRRNIKGDLQCLNFKEEKKENKWIKTY